jgi:hypothetical protein
MASKKRKEEDDEKYLDEKVPLWRNFQNDVNICWELCIICRLTNQKSSIILKCIRAGLDESFFNRNLIYIALEKQDIEVLSELIDRKTLNPEDHLKTCILNLYYYSFRFLLSKTENKDLKKELLQMAVNVNRPSIVQLLIDQGVDIFNLKLNHNDDIESLILLKNEQRKKLLVLLNYHLIEELSEIVCNLYN